MGVVGGPSDFSGIRICREKRREDWPIRWNRAGAICPAGREQRLTIARALVRKPEILILDDSASALDFATDAALRSAIAGMKEKPLVFIVSQRAASIWHADQILVLDDGKLVGQGTHEELLENCAVYQGDLLFPVPEGGSGK